MGSTHSALMTTFFLLSILNALDFCPSHVYLVKLHMTLIEFDLNLYFLKKNHLTELYIYLYISCYMTLYASSLSGHASFKS